MLTILFAGLVAELIMLPALLAGPLGRFCNPRPSRKAKAKARGEFRGLRRRTPKAADIEAVGRRSTRRRADSPNRTSRATPPRLRKGSLRAARPRTRHPRR